MRLRQTWMVMFRAIPLTPINPSEIAWLSPLFGGNFCNIETPFSRSRSRSLRGSPLLRSFRACAKVKAWSPLRWNKSWRIVVSFSWLYPASSSVLPSGAVAGLRLTAVKSWGKHYEISSTSFDYAHFSQRHGCETRYFCSANKSYKSFQQAKLIGLSSDPVCAIHHP